MKRTCKLLTNLSKILSSTKPLNSPPVISPLSTITAANKTFTPTENDQQEVPSKPRKDSFILESFKLRKLKGSAKINTENKPSLEPSNSSVEKNEVGLKGEKNCLSTEVVSSFQELGLREEMVKAVEKMGIFVPSDIQCVGIPAVLDGKSVVLSSGSGSGRTLAYLLPLVQMLRRDEALLSMKPKHPRAIVFCNTKESADQGFHMAKFISHYARLNSSMESSSDCSKALEDVSNAPIGMLVGTPSEVLEHIEDGNVSCDDVKYVVLDEADTLFDNDFGHEISNILNPLKDRSLKSNNQGLQVILVTATVEEMLGEQLSSLVEHIECDNAGKVTAMFLEMDQREAFDSIASPDALYKKIAEAMDSLHFSASES